MKTAFNLKPLNNQELMDMCFNEETLKDVYIAHLCVSINDKTQPTDKKDTLNLILQSNVAMIIQMELEMENRNILKKYRKNVLYPDFITEKNYYYESYRYRIQHLADLANNNQLTHEKINEYFQHFEGGK